jgi:hypothetical protein
MKTYLFAALIFLGTALTANAQCGGGQCRQPEPQPTGYEWQANPADPGRVYLYLAGRLLGGYDLAEDYYRPYDTQSDSWGEKTSPPVVPPHRQQQAFFGVDASKLTGSEKYTLHTGAGCQEITKSEAHGIVGSQLQDDSNKLRVTVIGNDSQQKQVAADLAKSQADLANWAIIRGYSPDHWALKPGFVTSGSPTIYCQAPTGKVLHRQDDYQGGGKALAEALRKAKDIYDPKNDKDLRKSGADVDLSKGASYGLALAAGVGGSVLLSRRKEGER